MWKYSPSKYDRNNFDCLAISSSIWNSCPSADITFNLPSDIIINDENEILVAYNNNNIEFCFFFVSKEKKKRTQINPPNVIQESKEKNVCACVAKQLSKNAT